MAEGLYASYSTYITNLTFKFINLTFALSVVSTVANININKNINVYDVSLTEVNWHQMCCLLQFLVWTSMETFYQLPDFVLFASIQRNYRRNMDVRLLWDSWSSIFGPCILTTLRVTAFVPILMEMTTGAKVAIGLQTWLRCSITATMRVSGRYKSLIMGLHCI